MQLLWPCLDFVSAVVAGSWLDAAADVHRLAVKMLSKALAVVPGAEEAEELSHAIMAVKYQADLRGLLPGAVKEERQTGMHWLQGGPVAGDCADGCGGVVTVRGSLEGRFPVGCDQRCHMLLKPGAWPETRLQQAADWGA